MEYEQELQKWAKRREKIATLYGSGMSFAEIGRKMDISRQRVREILIQNCPHLFESSKPKKRA